MTTTSGSGNFLDINGFKMYYEIHGEGLPLILLHGYSGSGAAIAQGFKSLSAKHQLIIPDLRGHGRSTNPSKEFTFRQAALDVIALLDHLKIAQCDALGFSGGGCTLLHVTYGQPERVKAMSIVSAVPYFPQVTRNTIKQYVNQTKTDKEWEEMRRIHLNGDEQIQSLLDNADAFAERHDDMNFTPAMLSKITTKTLIVQGDRDALYPLELTVELYKSMPNAYLWIIPNGQHVPVSPEGTPEFVPYFEKFITNN